MNTSTPAGPEHHDYPPLRVVPVPRNEPEPLETATVTALFAEHDQTGVRHRPAYVQSALAIDFRECGEDPLFGPQATRRSELPDPGPWARQIVAAVLECTTGLRPVGQLARWLDTLPREMVARRYTIAQRRGTRPLGRSGVLRVRVCEPADGVAEVSLVVQHEGRVRAVAARLSGVDGRWLVTALQIG